MMYWKDTLSKPIPISVSAHYNGYCIYHRVFQQARQKGAEFAQHRVHCVPWRFSSRRINFDFFPPFSNKETILKWIRHEHHPVLTPNDHEVKLRRSERGNVVMQHSSQPRARVGMKKKNKNSIFARHPSNSIVRRLGQVYGSNLRLFLHLCCNT